MLYTVKGFLRARLTTTLWLMSDHGEQLRRKDQLGANIQLLDEAIMISTIIQTELLLFADARLKQITETWSG